MVWRIKLVCIVFRRNVERILFEFLPIDISTAMNSYWNVNIFRLEWTLNFYDRWSSGCRWPRPAVSPVGRNMRDLLVSYITGLHACPSVASIFAGREPIYGASKFFIDFHVKLFFVFFSLYSFLSFIFFCLISFQFAKNLVYARTKMLFGISLLQFREIVNIIRYCNYVYTYMHTHVYACAYVI